MLFSRPLFYQSFCGRNFSSVPVYTEYSGNVFVPNWIHCSLWNIYGAEKTYSSALEAFKITEEEFPEGTFTIADLCSASCKNTMHAITKLVQDFRTRSNREVWIHPTLLPHANWNEYFKVALSAQYYGSLSNNFVSSRPGRIWKQLFPSQHLNFIYANHSFVPYSKMRIASDTIWPSMSEDPAIIKELRETAVKDFDTILTHRGKEIKKGGHFCFDLLLEYPVSKSSCLLLLNDVVTDFVAAGRIAHEERAKIGFGSCRRNDDVINEVLCKHSTNWRVVHKTFVNKTFPAWDQYKIDGDAQKLAKTYSEWIQEFTSAAIKMKLSPTRTEEEKQHIINDIYQELFKKTVAVDPIPLDIQVYDFVLQKL